MALKWKILWIFVFLYLAGIFGAGWHTYDTADPSNTVPVIETIKVVFIMLGGLGVIVPTYLNVWQSVETAKSQEEQARRNKIENTFRLIEKWDDATLFEARRFTRELKDQHGKLSPDELIAKINGTPELRQSVILVFNYFENVRISIVYDRVDASIIKHSLGAIIEDNYERMKPWLKKQGPAFIKDLNELSNLLGDINSV